MLPFRVLGFLLGAPFTLALLINSTDGTVTSSALRNLPHRSTPVECECDDKHSQPPKGMYCGSCKWSDTDDYVVTRGRNNSHLYFCQPPAACQDYGYNEDCDLANSMRRHSYCVGPF